MPGRLKKILNSSKTYKKNQFPILRKLVRFKQSFFHLFHLYDTTDVEGTIESISRNVAFRGVNNWMLICAALLASLGLDTNSPAVIIGAMLISPLMSPILGIGLGIGVNDKELMINSIKNFAFAVGLSLFASTTYFLLTPLGELTSEMNARTSPTLLDVGIAFFGGVAGIVAGSRKDKTTAIPGVAIATALMPPLCTSGFGLATGNMKIFFGAFYLFFLNAVFISLSTYFIVRLLRFPYRAFIDAKAKLKFKRWLAGITIIVIIPAAVIFIDVIDDIRTNKKIQTFISENVETENRNSVKWELIDNDSLRVVKVYLLGEPILPDEESSISEKLAKQEGDDLRIRFVQMNLPDYEREKIASETALNVLKTIEAGQIARRTEQSIIDSLNRRILRLMGDTIPMYQLKGEIEVLFPEIKDFSYANVFQGTNLSKKDTIPSFLISYNKRMSLSSQRSTEKKVETFLRQRLNKDTLWVISRN